MVHHLTLGSLVLALDDLLTKRLPPLQSFSIGAASVEILTLYRDNIAALPEELKGQPLAEELNDADDRHDGFGGSLWFSVAAVLRFPESTPEMVAAAEKIRAAFIPSLEELRARYNVEAKAAKDREPSLAKLEAELKMFSAPTGGTLYEVAAAFIQEGKKIDALLSARADAKDRKQATLLRGETMGKLNRLREDLLAAVKVNPALPADLENQVFSYFDLLETQDAAAAAEEKKKAAAKKAAAAEKAAAEKTAPAGDAQPPASPDPAIPEPTP